MPIVHDIKSRHHYENRKVAHGRIIEEPQEASYKFVGSFLGFYQGLRGNENRREDGESRQEDRKSGQGAQEEASTETEHKESGLHIDFGTFYQECEQ